MQSFKEFLEHLLSQQTEAISEFELLKLIKSEHPHFFESLPNPEQLYQQHFWLFHHLHQIQLDWLNTPRRLSISALSIQCLLQNDASQSIDEHNPLNDFYLDEKNLHLSPDEVAEMQKVFWQRYLAIEQKAESIKVLQLENQVPLTLKKIKQQFQKLAQKYHPDKGGDANYFQRVKRAYEELKQIF